MKLSAVIGLLVPTPVPVYGWNMQGSWLLVGALLGLCRDLTSVWIRGGSGIRRDCLPPVSEFGTS